MRERTRYDSKWDRFSRIFRIDHPVCYCDRVKAWDGTRVIVIECDEPGTIRPSQMVDHIRPLNSGGEDSRDNCQALCYRCHSVKTQRFG